MKKEYYIIKWTGGCLGSDGTLEKVVQGITNKKIITNLCNQYKRKNTNKAVIYWWDWNWIEKGDSWGSEYR